MLVDIVRAQNILLEAMRLPDNHPARQRAAGEFVERRVAGDNLNQPQPLPPGYVPQPGDGVRMAHVPPPPQSWVRSDPKKFAPVVPKKVGDLPLAKPPAAALKPKGILRVRNSGQKLSDSFKSAKLYAKHHRPLGLDGVDEFDLAIEPDVFEDEDEDDDGDDEDDDEDNEKLDISYSDPFDAAFANYAPYRGAQVHYTPYRPPARRPELGLDGAADEPDPLGKPDNEFDPEGKQVVAGMMERLAAAKEKAAKMQTKMQAKKEAQQDADKPMKHGASGDSPTALTTSATNATVKSKMRRSQLADPDGGRSADWRQFSEELRQHQAQFSNELRQLEHANQRPPQQPAEPPPKSKPTPRKIAFAAQKPIRRQHISDDPFASASRASSGSELSVVKRLEEDLPLSQRGRPKGKTLAEEGIVSWHDDD
jgi:hypothetical protein